MKRIYFITGSQDLYGEETLLHVAEDSKKIVGYLNEKLGETVEIKWFPTVKNNDDVVCVCQQASADEGCIGVICWMHTFSPAKMWIKGLQKLDKPLLHLHTQANERLPYDTIDMDFMNLNQSAHGDREFGFILTRLNIPHHIVVGYYQSAKVVNEIARFVRVAKAIDLSKHLKVAMLGNNMREVAVTDGDRVESQIKYGWEVNYYGIGDIADKIASVTPMQIDAKMAEYVGKYTLGTDEIGAVREQAKIEVALQSFLKENKIGAFCDTFQDLHGLKQLPGLSVQNLMADGIGFAAEGDYKTAALDAILMEMAGKKDSATGFMEDYTYDFADEVELGSHMLEVSPRLAMNKPEIQVHPLGIGGKEDPARLVFDGVTGDAVAVGMIDLGTHFRLIVTQIELIKQPHPMPQLPVARVMWKIKVGFENGIAQWLKSGGGHHMVVSKDVSVEDVKLFAELTGTDLVII